MALFVEPKKALEAAIAMMKATKNKSCRMAPALKLELEFTLVN